MAAFVVMVAGLEERWQGWGNGGGTGRTVAGLVVMVAGLVVMVAGVVVKVMGLVVMLAGLV